MGSRVGLEQLRLAVYRCFARTGLEPTVAGLADAVGASTDDVRQGLAALHEARHVVATRCPACRTPHAWVVDRHGPPAGSQLAHFLTPVSRIWDDVLRSCDNQRIYCDETCVDR
jgi:hypothetical protein